MKFLILMLMFSGGAWGWTKTYEGYQMFDAVPATSLQVEALRRLDDKDVMVFTSPVLNKETRLMISPENIEWAETFFKDNGLKYTDTGIDVAGRLRGDWSRLQRTSKAYNSSDFNTLTEIYGEVTRMADSCAGVGLTCTVEDRSPASRYGRQLKTLKISTGTFGEKPIFWIDSCIHAREWLACATGMNMIDKLISEANINGSDGARFLAKYDFTYLPVLNPDGYDFTWTNERYWRKNRRNNFNSTCDGVDLNRNWDNNWGGPGASPLKCSDTYHGPSAASEPETQAAVNYYNSMPAPRVFISIHTYGFYLLHPYGTGARNCSADCVNAADKVCRALEGTYDTSWDCGNGALVLYETSGGSTDWACDSGSEYCYTPELRGEDFVIDPFHITRSVQELWNGLLGLLNYDTSLLPAA